MSVSDKYLLENAHQGVTDLHEVKHWNNNRREFERQL